MFSRPTSLLLAQAITFSLLLGACAPTGTAAPSVTSPFQTATLPPSEASEASPAPPPSQTPLPPTAVPMLLPIEGSTTTQINVRTEPSTGGTALGLLPPFSPVQVVARDAGGNWYQILYPAAPDGKGWVRSQYVQVPNPDEIPPLSGAPGIQSGPSGTVTQQVNVRSGPGTSFNTLGTLNPQDSVTLTGRNPDSTWLQIAFSAGEGGLGWIAAGYIQGAEAGALPIIGEQGQVVGTGTPEAAPIPPTPTVLAAFEDGDSEVSPAVSAVFSPYGSGGLQYSSQVSAPQGDAADWVQFTPYLPAVSIQLTCQGSQNASAALLQPGAPPLDLPSLACGEKKIVHLTPGAAYQVRVDAAASAQSLESTNYTIIITTLR